MPHDQTCLSVNALIAPPCAPMDVSIELNMRIAASRVGKVLLPSDLFWFYKQVRNQGPWDFKQRGAHYAAFGNFHYGAVGRAIGLSDQILLRAAGWAQSHAGTSLRSYGDWTKDAPYGDDPADQMLIRNGIAFAKQKGY